MKDIELIARLNKDWRPKDIKIKRAGGQTNRNYIVQHKGQKFFVRLPWERADIVDRKIEAGNILAIIKSPKLKGVVPRFFLYVFKGRNILNKKERYNFPDGTMVMEYIEGRDISGKDLDIPKIQNALLKSLYFFHSSGVKFINVYNVFRDEVSRYKRKAKKYPVGKLIDKTKTQKIEKIEKRIRKKLPLNGMISTHNDLIFENLRLAKDGKIYIIDFEYAGYNIREGLYYDLGIILGGNLFYPKPITINIFEEILKKAMNIYKKNLDSEKIYYGALTNVLVMFWWGVIKYFSSKSKTDKRYFKKYVLKRADGIEYLYKFIGK